MATGALHWTILALVLIICLSTGRAADNQESDVGGETDNKNGGTSARASVRQTKRSVAANIHAIRKRFTGDEGFQDDTYLVPYDVAVEELPYDMLEPSVDKRLSSRWKYIRNVLQRLRSSSDKRGEDLAELNPINFQLDKRMNGRWRYINSMLKQVRHKGDSNRHSKRMDGSWVEADSDLVPLEDSVDESGFPLDKRHLGRWKNRNWMNQRLSSQDPGQSST